MTPRFLLGATLVDLDRGVLGQAQGEEPLSPIEAGLLGYLADRDGQTVSREELLVEVWGYRPGVRSRAVDHAVTRLRARLEPDPRQPRHLISVYGRGYRLDGLRALDAAPSPEPGLPDPRRTNLLPFTDPFIGRADLRQALCARLAQTPGAVVIVGPGGVGKTRLASELGLALARTLPGGAWFAALDEARSEAEVAAAAAAALGVAPDPQAEGAAVRGAVAAALAARGPALLILDNAEQAQTAVVSLVAALQAGAPEARLLLTSREAVAGAAAVELGPLSPEEARALFCARMSAQRPRGGAAQEAAIQALCDRLDRLPLALALAAGLTDLQSPSALLDRVTRGGGLWLGAEGGGRHASMEQALRWSWALLSAPEREAWLRLAAFRGGFSTGAALALLGPGGPELLRALRSRSLLLLEEDATGELRGRMLDSVRSFGLEQLREAPNRADVLQQVSQITLAQCEPEVAALRGAEGAAAAARLEREVENLCAAAARFAGRSPDLAARACLAAEAVLRFRGPPERRRTVVSDALVYARQAADPALLSQALLGAAGSARADRAVEAARALVAEALALTAAEPQARARALTLTANLDLSQGRLRDAASHATEAARVLPSPSVDRVDALRALCNARLAEGDLGAAEACGLAALAEARALGDLRSEAALVGNLANLLLSQGRLLEAEARYREALALARALGDRREEAFVLGSVGNLHYDAGRGAEAEAAWRAALALHRQVGDRASEARTLCNLAHSHLERGDLAVARRLLGEAFAAQSEAQDARGRAFTDATLGMLELSAGDPARGTQHLRAARLGFEATGDTPGAGLAAALESVALAEGGHLDEAAARLATVPDTLPEAAELLPWAAALLAAARGEAERPLPPPPTISEARFVAGRLAALQARRRG